MRPIIGLDPGQKTGVSVFHGGNGAIQYLLTVSPDQIDALLIEHMPRLLVFEDSRRQSAVFGRGVNPRAMLKIARNVGEVDQICRQICETCRKLEIDVIAVSPLAKGAKMSAEQFRAHTGWSGRSNQHERDAAMVAWQYRRMRQG